MQTHRRCHQKTPKKEQTKAWQRKTGFTLVELLVVIGLVVLLVVILLPVFARVREKAHQTSCISNLHQVGLAIAQYGHDNNGEMFPTIPYADGSGSITEWYFHKTLVPKPTIDKTQGPLISYIKDEGVWVCPSAPDVEMPYGINREFSTAQVELGHPISTAQVDVPSETILVAEILNTNFSLSWWEGEPVVYPPSAHTPYVNGRHSGLANVLWFDGHVTSQKPVASYPAHYAGGGYSVSQLQELKLGDILKGSYTGVSGADDYYYLLKKGN